MAPKTVLYTTFRQKHLMHKLEDRPDGRVVDVLVFRRRRLGSNPESVKLTQVAIDSPTMQPCTVCLGASCGDGLSQLATP